MLGDTIQPAREKFIEYVLGTRAVVDSLANQVVHEAGLLLDHQ